MKNSLQVSSVVLERVVGFSLAIAVTATLSRGPLQYFTFWYGHAHILLAWLYRYSSGVGGRGRTAALFFLLNGGLFASYYSSSTSWFGPLALTTNLFFLYHLVTDEVYLFKVPLNLRVSPLHLGRFLEALFLFVLAAAPMLDGLPYYGPQLWGDLGLPAMSWARLSGWSAMSLLAVYAWVVRRGLHRPDGGSLYLAGWGLSMATANALWGPFSHYQWFSFVVVLHVTHWYIHYYLSARSDPARLRVYVLRVLASNAFFGLLLLPLVLDLGNLARNLATAVYGIQNYYLWTLGHLIVSTRGHDLAAFLRPAAGPAKPI